MNTEIYLYIPRDKILNKIKRKHRTKDFRDIYFYRNKNKYVFNEKNIKEIEKRDNTYKKNKFKQLKKKIEYNKLKKNSQHNNKISKKSFIVDFS